MKILYYSPHPHLHLQLKSGPGVHIREMIRAFEGEGHTVVPLIMGGHEAPEEPSGRQAEKPLSLKQRLKKFIPNIVWQTAKDLSLVRFDRQASAKLEALIAREKPDLIYERGFYMMTSGVRAAKKYGIRHILEMNAPYEEERIEMEGASMLQFLGRRRTRMQVESTSKLVVVSNAMAEYVTALYPFSAPKLLVLPNAIRADFEPPDEANIVQLRRQWGIDDRTVIGFIGSIFKYHGVDVLLDAFAALSEQAQDRSLLIVGDGAILDELKARAAERGIQDRVVFTGRVSHEEAFTYIGAMDIAVMPTSNWYGSPVKIFEYGIMRKAIVAPDVGPVHDVIQHQVHGLIATRENLQAALSELLDDAHKRERMAEAFYQKVKSEHTWAVNARKTVDFGG